MKLQCFAFKVNYNYKASQRLYFMNLNISSR